ncbi:hypothetical protein MMPV_002927 [Pyropia vietnamensis]
MTASTAGRTAAFHAVRSTAVAPVRVRRQHPPRASLSLLADREAAASAASSASSASPPPASSSDAEASASASASAVTAAATAAAAATTTTTTDTPPVKVQPLRLRNGRYANPFPTWPGYPTAADAARLLPDALALLRRGAPPGGGGDTEAATPARATPRLDPPVGTPARLTWLGHASVLAQLGGGSGGGGGGSGVSVLFDPVFADRASPVQWAGPARMGGPPPVACPADLPPIDAVAISHNHYDHLSRGCVVALEEAHTPVWAVPAGVGRWMRRVVPAAAAAGRIHELSWWEDLCLVAGGGETRADGRPGGVVGGGGGRPFTLSFLPAQHWSSRTPWDRGASLWGSWGLRMAMPASGDGGGGGGGGNGGDRSGHSDGSGDGNFDGSSGDSGGGSGGDDGGASGGDGGGSGGVPGGGPPVTIWFAGDTGWAGAGLYRAIRSHLGGHVDVAAIPIGAYAPRWFMARQHINVPEAVRVFQEVGAAEAFGIHWGTFPLTTEPLMEPATELARLTAAAGIADRFVTLGMGESRDYGRLREEDGAPA